MADAMTERQRLGVSLRDPLPWRDLAMLVETAEETGFETAFFPEIGGGRDTLAAITGLGAHTTRIHLGPGVAPVPSRRLPLLAMAAATAKERTGGRLVLGLGSGPPGPGSLDRVRGAVEFLREAFGGGTPKDPDTGEPFGLALSMDAPPPIWLAALGDRMVSLAGEIAEGVLLNWCTPDRVRRAAALIAESASLAGRDPASVTIGVYVRGCLGAEESLALEALRVQAGSYAAMPHYRRQMAAFGLGDAAREAASAIERGRPDEVPEELVRELCLLGDADAAKARLDEFREAGAALPVVYPVPVRDAPSSIMSTMLAVAPSPVLQP
jgi:alkanesulfonate monooxygenase SsuD/methylene tetrahydromethanopterin reductase-like flavin-dependent oxidoreductase (luciferase family)